MVISFIVAEKKEAKKQKKPRKKLTNISSVGEIFVCLHIIQKQVFSVLVI